MEKSTERDTMGDIGPSYDCDRVGFLIDGENYYHAVREAIKQAQYSVLLLGWDVDSRTDLLGDHEDDGLPHTLGDFLNEVVAQRPQLEIHILVWDFAMIYALEREWLPIFKLGWQTHSRLHFHMDDRHPPGASHHQKVVVVDDKVAFAGGFDLSKWRWDRRAHRADEPRRVDPAGAPYPPFHDIQMAVDGEAARALGELARRRWHEATGETLQPPPQSDSDPWPPDYPPLLHDTPVTVSLTEPTYGARHETREVEELYLALIRRAEQTIYIENQYFTSRQIAEALADRLSEEAGPEIVMVLPLRTGGWLEQHTMDVLRDRLLRFLQEEDHHGRLRIYYPKLPGTGGQFVQVHSKIMVVDDRWLTVGSANLSNRSMGLDTECNLTLEADSAEQRSGVAHFRNDLLGEHLDHSAGEVENAIEAQGGVIAAIERLSNGERTLQPLKPVTPPEVDRLVPDAKVVDPEQPIDPDKVVDMFVEREDERPAGTRLLGGAAILGSLLLLAVLWRWTPLGDALTTANIQELFQTFAEMPASPLVVIGAFVVAGLVVVPLTLMVVVSVLTFGPIEGLVYAHIGATLSSLAAYGIGHRLGRSTVRQMAGSGINRLSRRLGERGVLAVIVLRIIPVAPFTVVNLVAGASHISFRDFAVGTILGLLPGMLALSAFVDGVQRTMVEPEAGNFTWLAVVVVLIAFGGYLLRRGLQRRAHLPQEAVERGGS